MLLRRPPILYRRAQSSIIELRPVLHVHFADVHREGNERLPLPRGSIDLERGEDHLRHRPFEIILPERRPCVEHGLGDPIAYGGLVREMRGGGVECHRDLEIFGLHFGRTVCGARLAPRERAHHQVAHVIGLRRFALDAIDLQIEAVTGGGLGSRLRGDGRPRGRSCGRDQQDSRSEDQEKSCGEEGADAKHGEHSMVESISSSSISPSFSCTCRSDLLDRKVYECTLIACTHR